MDKEMANLMALAPKPPTKLQQTNTSLVMFGLHGGGITVITVAMHLDLMAVLMGGCTNGNRRCCRGGVEVEFAGGHSTGEQVKMVALAVEIVFPVVVAVHVAWCRRGEECCEEGVHDRTSLGLYELLCKVDGKSGRASSVGVDSIGQLVSH
ncbi:hypothetical protein EDC04DRAFT_2601914 [Pisolithus marmoratus]|nr:hypothetical protein EDC04DRAFT_2601914 [Pisolithus marmoratus]